MNTKIFGFLLVLLMISIIPVADAQISIGEKAVQKSVEVIINSVGDVHVKHVIRSSNVPIQVELIIGTVSNLLVTNEQGEEKQFAVIGNNSGVLILTSQGNPASVTPRWSGTSGRRSAKRRLASMTLLESESLSDTQ